MYQILSLIGILVKKIVELFGFMSQVTCPECGITLSKEIISTNMCWECGKILDERLLDDDFCRNLTKYINRRNVRTNR